MRCAQTVRRQPWIVSTFFLNEASMKIQLQILRSLIIPRSTSCDQHLCANSQSTVFSLHLVRGARAVPRDLKRLTHRPTNSHRTSRALSPSFHPIISNLALKTALFTGNMQIARSRGYRLEARGPNALNSRLWDGTTATELATSCASFQDDA